MVAYELVDLLGETAGLHPSSVRIALSSFKPGGERLLDEGDERTVYPHGRVLLTHDTESGTGVAVRYVYVEVTDEDPSMPWGEFRRQMRAAGLKLGKGVGTREIKAPAATLRAKQLTRPRGHRP